MQVQLIYVSRPTTETSKAVLEFIPEAQYQNKLHNISGLIASGETFYIQLLEGERTVINQLYENIIKDPRHTDIVLLRYTEIKEPEFQEWSMVHVTEEELLHHYVAPIIMPSSITPKSLSGVQALALMRRLSALMRVLHST